MLFWNRKTLVTYCERMVLRRSFWVLFAIMLIVAIAVEFWYVYQPLAMQHALTNQLLEQSTSKQQSLPDRDIEPVAHGALAQVVEQSGCVLKQQQVKVRMAGKTSAWLEYTVQIEGSFKLLHVLCTTLAEHAAYKVQQLTVRRTEQGTLQTTMVVQVYEVET